MPASVAPLAAMAAQLIVPPICGDVILICLVISRFALPTFTASLAAALASSPACVFCCMFVAIPRIASVVFLSSSLTA
jgi:hypothetical protein